MTKEKGEKQRKKGRWINMFTSIIIEQNIHYLKGTALAARKRRHLLPLVEGRAKRASAFIDRAEAL